MTKKLKIEWLSKPADKDYPAAESYLLLLFEPKQARALAKKLRRAAMSEFAAKDILRASETPIAQIQAYDWVKQNVEIEQGKPISPVLLVRQNNGGRLIIADGFHRVCAAFAVDQEISVACKIV